MVLKHIRLRGKTHFQAQMTKESENRKMVQANIAEIETDTESRQGHQGGGWDESGDWD